MNVFIILLSITSITGCIRTTLDKPEVTYRSETSIGVSYGSANLVARANEREAMEIIRSHCKNRYRITNRDRGQIDAECL